MGQLHLQQLNYGIYSRGSLFYSPKLNILQCLSEEWRINLQVNHYYQDLWSQEGCEGACAPPPDLNTTKSK